MTDGRKERMLVYVDGAPVSLFRGMEVRHALISRDPALYEAAQKGLVEVKDESGFALGLEGSLREGARIHTLRKDGTHK